MTRRALVLGGGGTIGIAWEIGVLKGLSDAGVQLANADQIIGTSAGSVVGAQLALGQSVDVLLAEQRTPDDRRLLAAMRFDPQTVLAIGAQWAALAEVTTADRATLGAAAVAAATAEEQAWVAVFEERLQGAPWPASLVVTAVDAADGSFVAWDQAANVPLAAAVAASCCVPGLFPPVTINGRRYIDGGVRSGTSADLAQGAAAVVLIAPMSAQVPGTGRLAQRQIETEVAQLEATGSAVVVIQPDAAALAAFGPNLMDVTRRAGTADAGIAQGRAAAERVQAVWTRL